MKPLQIERMKRQVAHLHTLGPRPLYEFLVEFAGNDLKVDLDHQLARYARLDPGLVAALDAREIRHRLVAVQGGRR